MLLSFFTFCKVSPGVQTVQQQALHVCMPQVFGIRNNPVKFRRGHEVMRSALVMRSLLLCFRGVLCGFHVFALEFDGSTKLVQWSIALNMFLGMLGQFIPLIWDANSL